MATCQEFKRWLIDQNAAGENIPHQVKGHLQVCETCQNLYQVDMALDAVLKNSMQAVEPPAGLIRRVRQKIESESRPYRMPQMFWKTAIAALSLAALVFVILLNPFAGHLQTVDELAAFGIANHLDTEMQMVFRAGEIDDVGQWFSRRLAYAVRLPDLNRLGLKLLGGRECAFGKVDAALLFCKSRGKRVSLFMLNPDDVGLRFDKQRKYTVEEGDFTVSLWKESGMVYAMVI